MSFIFNEISSFRFLKFETRLDCRSLSASGGLPHLPASGIFELRQIPSSIVDYGETTPFPAWREFATLKTSRSGDPATRGLSAPTLPVEDAARGEVGKPLQSFNLGYNQVLCGHFFGNIQTK